MCDRNGDYNIDTINQLIDDMGFRRENYELDASNKIPWGQVRISLESPNCLGLVLLKGRGGGHYTAVSNTIRNC
jgi:hypothetical protein